MLSRSGLSSTVVISTPAVSNSEQISRQLWHTVCTTRPQKASVPWNQIGGYEKAYTTVTTFPTFTRRRNGDSSIDSICTKCFATIASAGSAEELVAYEEKHICDPYWAFSEMHFNPYERTHAGQIPSSGRR
jgi:hypothetical protein